jgi:glycogen synthase
MVRVSESRVRSRRRVVMGFSPSVNCVLMTADAVGGVWQYALELARAFGMQGIRTILAVAGPPPGADHMRAAAEVRGLEVLHEPFRLEWMADADDDIGRTGDWLLGLERRYRPDVIHLNGFSAGALPWRAPHLVVAHSCSLSWWNAVRRSAWPESLRGYSERVAAGLRGADIVIAPTAAFLAEIERLYGHLPCKRVIWNGRSRDQFQPGDKEPFVFTAGRLWDEAKNLAALDAAAPRLPWPIFAAGGMQAPDGGMPRLSHIGHLGNVTPDQLRDWLSRASIFALPARYEPFGLAVLEAALSGCALVLGDIPTFRELWDGAASFVDPEDHDQLEGAITDLAGNRLRLDKLAEAASTRAERYSAESMANRYLQTYAAIETAARRPAVVAG